VFFLILHLFQFWTGTSAWLESILVLDGNLSMAPLVVHSAPDKEPPNVVTQSEETPLPHSFEDDDLLDY
jgi:hypothetical protein